MSHGVEADPDIALGLMLSDGGTAPGGVSYGAVEIVGPDLEMHHHLLVAGACGPDRSDVGGLVWKDRVAPPSGLVSTTQSGSSALISQPSNFS